MKKRIFAVVMAAVLTLSMVACGETQTGNETTPTPTAEATPTTVPATPTPEPTKEPAPQNVSIAGASITFEDGKMDFVQPYMQHAASAEIELSVVDFNGSKALKVVNVNGKTPYIGIDVASLLGANVAKVAKVDMVVGTSYDDGSFYAVAGEIFSWWGADLNEAKLADWSVYMQKKNPKVTSATVPAGCEFAADANNIMLINLKTDNGLSETGAPATFYLDDICFYDKDGNILTADTSVAFVGPEKFAGSGLDLTNLCALTGAVEWEDAAASAGGWAQAGVAFTDEIKAALVPGSVIEISYKSDTGNMWVVMNESAAGWKRVGVGDIDGSGTTASYMNNSKTTAQVTYEQIASICGDDINTWGSGLQFESDGAWEVFSVKVGQAAPVYALAGAVEWEGAAASAGAWTQAGPKFTDAVTAALVPGSVLEIAYTSDTGNLWVVMNESAAGWKRVGVGNIDGSNSPVVSTCYDGKCYVTYEQIASLCGEDITTWGSGLQFESDGAWEVFSVKVGKACEMKMASRLVNWEGAAASAGGWAQAGVAFTDEIKAALVPGSVLNIAYTSDTGNLWVVMNEAAVGWKRVGVGNIDGSNSPVVSACNNGICQVTYDQIASICGDISTWGSGLQFESDGAWEVFSVTVGQMPATATTDAPATDAPATDAPATETPVVEDPITVDYKAQGGDWSAKLIDATPFAGITGDANVTVTFRQVTEGYTYWQFCPLNAVDPWAPLTAAEDYVGTAPTFNDWGWADIPAGNTTVTFTLSAAAVAKITDGAKGFGIQCYGIVVDDIKVEAVGGAATETPVETPVVTPAPTEAPAAEAAGVSYELTTTPGDWGASTSAIPASAFAGLTGGVKIVVEFTQETADYYNLALQSNAASGWFNLKDYITNQKANDWGYIDTFAQGDTSMTVELSADGVAKLNADANGLLFQVYALNVTKATVIPVDAATEAPKTETPAVSEGTVTGTFSGTYAGTWGAEWIPGTAFADCTNGATVVINLACLTADEAAAVSWVDPCKFTVISSADGWAKFTDDKYYTSNKPAFDAKHGWVDVNDVTTWTLNFSAELVNAVKNDKLGIQVGGVKLIDWAVTPVK